MEKEDKGKSDIAYSTVVKAGKRRTYFMDVRRNRGDDYFITITESTRKFNNDGYERHKILLYKEDFNRFLSHLKDSIDYVKNDLRPDFDYEQAERRQADWEASQDVGEPKDKKEDDLDW